jgi:hypothetical protein
MVRYSLQNQHHGQDSLSKLDARIAVVPVGSGLNPRGGYAETTQR